MVDAQAQLESIKEMIAALDAANDANDEEAREEAETAIRNDPLSVETRSGWHCVGTEGERVADEEYRILLCTGGPAVQIIGNISEHGEPESARLQHQDWGTRWTDLHISSEDEAILVIYACQHVFI